ncbi:hypothetical protein PAXINDRAFT_157791 [Paxillus involutus ATCC 200175]|uniref:Uncharacterized protein n=1 Tax=Paxillus involutus ATCC 200175 TaxID=664439 RepID=A0A0C9TGG3_PAXIN|nr:hypothetical protein PAXINDRAFT_157791 [Paxillus involutus ATCC 200175]
MPRHTRPGPVQDQGEEMIDLDGSDLGDGSGQDEDEEQRDQEQITAIIQPPPPDADIPTLRKALSLAQRALTETDADLHRVKKELFALTAALPPKKRKGILNKSDSLNESIGQVAKKFTILYRLWVIDGLFPIVNNTGVDLSSTTRWASPEAKCNAVITELFTITPQVLTKEIHAYKAFSSVFTSALNQERSNMLRAIKEASTLVFAPLKISDPTIFTFLAHKRDDPEMKRLSMKDGSHHRLSPILFANPDQILPEGFLRSPVLINIIRLLISGRTALTGKKARGGPKARGQIYSVHSVTEGLVAGAAIFACYLLTPDTELQAVGSETKIPYKGDYDFYLEHLYKRSPWAIETMNFFNVKVFGNNKAREKSSEPTVSSAPLCTWEDDFLEDLDNAGSPVRTTTGTSASAQLNFTGNSSSTPANGSPPVTPPSEFSGSSSIPHTCMVSKSRSQVDEEISKFSDTPDDVYLSLLTESLRVPRIKQVIVVSLHSELTKIITFKKRGFV